MKKQDEDTGAREYGWGHTRRFNALSNYFTTHFGGRIQKLSIDAGFTCPNRDGTKGTGGCTFCLNDAFNPSYCTPDKPVRQQLEEGIRFHRKRYPRVKEYLAYFQAYSNTYAPLPVLQKLYGEALSVPGVAGLVLGTRPDCMDDEILDYLQELASDHFLVVEYGIESCYEETLLRINRGHSFADTRKAIERTAGRGILTGGHLIFGLPGESPERMLEEAAILSSLPLHSLKFHQLQIIKGTAMEAEYLQKPDDFHLFGLDEYLTFIVSFLELLSPSIVVERFAGESPPRYLAGPTWGGVRNDRISLRVEQLMEQKDTWQGKYYSKTVKE